MYFRHHKGDFCVASILYYSLTFVLQLKLGFSLVGCLFSDILIFVIRKQIALVRIVKMKGTLELFDLL